jgi:hypothetical protein
MRTTRILRAMLVVVWGMWFLPVAEAQQEAVSSPYTQLMEQLARLTPSETIDVQMGPEKDQYELGEPFEMRLQVDQDCYIVLMDISTNGDITFIVPSIQVPEGKVEAQRVYSTLHDFGLEITIAPPSGIETLNLFCSSEKIELFEADFEREPFYTISKDDQERIQDLMARLEQLQNYEWSGGSVQIFIGPKSRAVPRKLGALPPIAATGTTGKFFPPIGSTGTSGKTDDSQTDSSESP